MGHWDVKIRFRYYYYFDLKKKTKQFYYLQKEILGPD